MLHVYMNHVTVTHMNESCLEDHKILTQEFADILVRDQVTVASGVC